jgi:hypothetical protein
MAMYHHGSWIRATMWHTALFCKRGKLSYTWLNPKNKAYMKSKDVFKVIKA